MHSEMNQMKKRMLIMLISVGILFGLIFGWKAFKNHMISQYLAARSHPTFTVSAMKVGYSDWKPRVEASASLRALKGVNVTTELAGKVQKIYFTSGSEVKEGTLLVQLNVDPDVAQLHALQANAELAKITYNRDKAQFKVKAVSQATLDADLANLKNYEAQVAEQAATIAKKTVRAPFTGRLGISSINPGQYVNAGDNMVTLQTLDPIFADFFIPQQLISRVKVGQTVRLTSDSFPGKIFQGKVTSSNSMIDTATRNIEVEATIANPTYDLVPGMFANVQVYTGVPQRYLTLPQTAISYNPYGETVFVVKETGKDKDNKPILTASQLFVTTGEKRGDQTIILEGLKEGDYVVTSGQIKLKNGSQVVIDNSVVPENNPNPTPVDE